MGKSALCNILSKGWANGSLLEETFDLVLSLSLHDKEIADAETVSDMLLPLHRDKDVCDAVSDHLIKVTEGRSLLILLDGWDELQESKRKHDSFYSSLLLGKPLPFASILVTSRQYASIELHSVESIDRFVAIDGFDEENMQKFIELEFADKVDSGRQLLMNLEHSPAIHGLCTVPLNCSIICYLWKITEGHLPPTMTELYTNLIMNVVLSETGLKTISSFDELSQKPWKFVCELAYQGLKNEQLIFLDKDLKKLFPDSSGQFACFNLLQRVESSLSVGSGISFHFLHLTFQEYLAALHLAMKDPQMQMEHIRSICLMPMMPDQFQHVLKFFFGLISGRSVVSKNISPLKKDLWSLFSELISRRGISRLPNFTFAPVLLLCHCAYEAGNKFIDAEVAKLLSGTFQGLYTNSIQDCASVAYIIARSSAYSPLVLKFFRCSLSDTHLKVLLLPLRRAAGELQVRELNLDRNMLSLESLHVLVRSSKSFTNLEYLAFECSKDEKLLDKEFVQYFIQSLPRSLCHLSLNGVLLSAESICAFQSAVQDGQLPHLKKLILNNVFDVAATDEHLICNFLYSLQECCPQLTSLDLSQSTLGVTCVQALGSVVQKLEKLERLGLDETGINNEGLMEFSSGIKRAQSLERLSLMNNKVEASGMVALCDKISQGAISLTVLDISHNPLGVAGARALSKAISSERCVLEVLSLENCSFLSVGCLSIALSLSSNSRLDIIKLERNILIKEECTISDVESLNTLENSLPSSLSTTSAGSNHSVKMLSLANNVFSADNVLIVAVAILCCSAMTFLECSNCYIDSATFKALFKKLAELRQSNASRSTLEVWDLRNNAIGDDGVATLLLNLHFFPKLVNVFLERNHVSNEMMETLVTKMQERTMEEEHLQEKVQQITLALGSKDKKPNKVASEKALYHVEKDTLLQLLHGMFIAPKSDPEPGSDGEMYESASEGPSDDEEEGLERALLKFAHNSNEEIDPSPSQAEPQSGLDFQSYVSSLPACARPHLELQLDWGHGGVERDLCEIANNMLDWEEKLAVHLELTQIDFKHRGERP